MCVSHLSVEVMHAQELHTSQEGKLVQLLGDLEVPLEVVSGEGVEQASVHQVADQRLSQVPQATVTGPLKRHPAVVYLTSLRELTAGGRGWSKQKLFLGLKDIIQKQIFEISKAKQVSAT